MESRDERDGERLGFRVAGWGFTAGEGRVERRERLARELAGIRG